MQEQENEKAILLASLINGLTEDILESVKQNENPTVFIEKTIIALRKLDHQFENKFSVIDDFLFSNKFVLPFKSSRQDKSEKEQFLKKTEKLFAEFKDHIKPLKNAIILLDSGKEDEKKGLFFDMDKIDKYFKTE